MDSKWYLFPGQTLENTKISDRVHALHINKTAWKGITKHLDRKKLLQEAADKEAAVKRYLDDGSKNMTKGWENSLENVRKRKEEEKLRLIEQKKEDRQKQFLHLRKEQEEIRKQYMDNVQKQIFMTTGHARDLTSALVLTETLHERKKQIEFQDIIKLHELEEDKKYAEFVKKEAEKEIIEKEEGRKKVIEKEKKYGEVLKKMVTEKHELETKMKEQKVKSELVDNIEAVKEIEKLEQLQIQDKLTKKKELFKEKQSLLQKQKELEQQRIKEEKELDEVIEIYKSTKEKIDCLRKQKEKEMQDEAVQRRQKVAEMVGAEQQNRSEAEERSIKKAIAEREAAEMAKIKAKKEFAERMKQERLRNIEEVKQRLKAKEETEKEVKKWELINRYKTDENTKKYEEKKRREMWQEILNYRNVLLEQMEENRVEQERERAIENAFIQSSLEEENDKFFEYANEVLELAKKKGRSTIPIERVIAKYVKEMNIKTDKKNDKCGSNSESEKLRNKLIKDPKLKKCRCVC